MITLGSNFVIYNLPTCDVNFPVLRHYLGCQYDVINIKSFHETLGYLLQILVTPLYLAHCYNAFIEYSDFHIIFLTFSYSRKRNNSKKVGITLFSLLMAKTLFLFLMYSQFLVRSAVKLGSFDGRNLLNRL